MLACAIGMSTSILVDKIKNEIASQGKDYEIWAVNQSSIEDEIGKFDVLLLAPQVKHMTNRIKNMVGDIPLGNIPPMDYGRSNAKAIIELAEKLNDERN